MLHLTSPDIWLTLVKVVFIDLVLAGDNAIVIGMAAAGLPQAQRGKAILVGVIAATVLRICFAFVALELLKIIGLALVGGLLLLWVCWKMWRELRHPHHLDANGQPKPKTFMAAAWQIVVADVSMSLDNVLAVAGAAHEHPKVLIGGLILSVALMGIAANFIAKLLHRYPWISYLGLVIILYVAAEMIWRGGHQVWPHIGALVS